ncbi:MAG TPA: PKD domain-containing protein, partial [Candidatus Thermoplasmatota archaeon]|nr:PKD domain-containing protein [Candidatus Thermoplasmatota archaeon]
AGEPVTLRLADPNVTASWDFGDGTLLTGSEATYTFEQPGLYGVRVSANGATETLVVPVHTRERFTLTLTGPLVGETSEPAISRTPVDLGGDAARIAASARAVADRANPLGAAAVLRLETPEGAVLSESRALLAPGEAAVLAVSVPVGRLPPPGTAVALVLEVGHGTISFTGQLEVYTDDPL